MNRGITVIVQEERCGNGRYNNRDTISNNARFWFVKNSCYQNLPNGFHFPNIQQLIFTVPF